MAKDFKVGDVVNIRRRPRCGRAAVQSNADMTRYRLHDLIVEKNNDPKKRRCASCGDKD